jgi:hypothetical protein
MRRAVLHQMEMEIITRATSHTTMGCAALVTLGEMQEIRKRVHL